MRISTSLIIAVFTLFLANSAMGIGFGDKLKDIAKGGGGSSDAAGSGLSLADAEDKLLGTFNGSLDNLLAAQALLIQSGAVKGQSAAKAAELESARGECKDKDCLEKKVALSNELMAATEGMEEEEVALTEEGKTLYRKALPLYAAGSLEMIQLIPTAQQWLNSAMDEIKGAGFTGAAKMKKKLATGMYVARNIPKLAKAFGSSTKRVIRVGKANKIEAEGANEADFG